MENKKMTKKEMFALLLAMESVQAEETLVAFINHEIELLEKKKSSGKATKTQQANEEVKETILEVLLQADDRMTVSDLIKKPELEMYTNQKISALLKQLVDGGMVVKEIEKKVSYFSLPLEEMMTEEE